MEIDPLSLFIGFLAGGALIYAYLEIRNMRNEINEIKKDEVKRLPHGTLATLEDIMAVANDTHFQNGEVDELVKSLLYSQAMRTYQDIRFENISQLVKDIQDSPRRYKARKNRKVNILK